ncbi:hypothetical protein AB0J72_18950 [Dactylosporangium sp. NPDC049742]|uniref:hypothetical protein n=1 Tax=Dactylosporangium sp. NPDC049742 TaxID=3154737 RepID=UPI00341E2065
MTDAGAARRADAVAVGALLAAVPVVHRIGPALDAPYWLDESWVALAAKAPLADLPWVTASTPLGWTLLVWSVPGGGQLQRLIPLLFLAGSVLAGYAFGRCLGWPGRGWAVAAGLAAGAATLLIPAQLVRHDLKQYTAEGAVALLLLAMTAWLESAWSRRRLVLLGAGVVAGMLFSHPAALIGAAVLGAVLLTSAVGAPRGRLRDTALVSAGTAAAALLVYVVLDRPNRNDALAGYWSGYFPTVGGLPSYLGTRLAELTPALGAPWQLVAAAAAVGVVAVARLRRPATALALLLIPVIVVAAALAGVYPLLDQRTSHFLLVVAAAVAGTGLVRTAADLTGHLPARTRARTRSVVAAVLVVTTVSAYAIANSGALLRPPAPGDPGEDVRAQVAYVASHRRPGDVIAVNMSGQFGFAYYWTEDPPLLRRGGPMATGWYVSYTAGSRILVATGRDTAAVADLVAAAERLAGAGGRIWLVRSHVNADERAAWQAALAGGVVDEVTVGPEPLATLTVGQAPGHQTGR